MVIRKELANQSKEMGISYASAGSWLLIKQRKTNFFHSALIYINLLNALYFFFFSTKGKFVM